MRAWYLAGEIECGFTKPTHQLTLLKSSICMCNGGVSNIVYNTGNKMRNYDKMLIKNDRIFY